MWKRVKKIRKRGENCGKGAKIVEQIYRMGGNFSIGVRVIAWAVREDRKDWCEGEGGRIGETKGTERDEDEKRGGAT